MISEAHQGFSALPGVEQEIQQIAAKVSTKRQFAHSRRPLQRTASCIALN